MAHRSITRSLAAFAIGSIVAAACGGAAQPSPSTAPSAAPATSAAAATAAPTAAPVLSRPVEFVISTGPGGGSDIYARLWIGYMQAQKALTTSVLPVNKEGGAGAVAFTYVYQHKGDPHYILVTLNSFFTTIITQKLPYKSSDFTPLANMAEDPFFLWVNEDSPWKTAQDVIAAAKANSLTVSGTGSKQEDEVLFRRIEQVAGTKPFNYIPQSGGGKVAAALAGHQDGVVVTVNNPSEGASLMAGKKLRPVCAFLPDSPKDAPFTGLATCKSQGLAIDDYYNLRAIVGPPGLTEAQTAFWANVFKKVNDSPDWQKYMKDNALRPDFRTGAELKKLFADYTKLHEEIAQKNGWVK